MLHPQRAGGLCSSAPTLVAAPGPSRRCPLARSRPGGAAVRRAGGKEERAVGAGSSLKEQEQQQEQQPRVTVDYEDPDATYGIRSITNAGRAAGRFGRPYKLPSSLPSWMYKWMRDPLESRKHDELVELVVLNERLAGGRAHEVRQKLDWLRRKTSNWDYIYQYITACDGKATLQMVEEANQKVEEALREQDTTSVETMQAKLLGLQEEISEASDKLRLSESRVSTNLRRVDDLKAEAASLERIRLASGPTSTVDQEQEGIQSRLRESRGASTSYAHEQPRTSQAWRSPRSKKNRRLRSSLELEDRLRNFWYPAEFSKTLEPGVMVPFDLFNTPWVLFRDETGAPACIKDSCAHRACPLSLGKLVDGHVQCAYHGWEFDGTGTCTKMPSTKLCSGVGVAALPCFEKDGFVWVWPGDEPPKGLPPDYTAPPPGYDVHAEIMVDVPVEHGLMLENLLDLAHAPFTHTTTFARGWPIPDAVRFHATRMLAGDWDPYPISMSFNPPCIVLSTIGLSQPGKIMRGYRADQCKRHLHQLHVCMPAKRGHTRLLYRMSLDFWGWLRHVPFIEQLWKQIAGQVLGEDLVLVQGQQERLIAGDDTWNMPMPYDKLAVRYRRWRNMVADGEYEAGARIAAQANMSAGQMFSDEEETDEDDGDADDGSTSNGQPWRQQQQQQQQAKGSRVKEEHLDEAAVQRR